LKAAARSDLIVGGPNLAAQALEAGLVDECQLFIWPVILGGGNRALPADMRAKCPNAGCLFIANTRVSGNSGTTAIGLLAHGQATAVLDRTIVSNNASAVGVRAQALGPGDVLDVTLTDSILSNNSAGVIINPDAGVAVVRLRRSTIVSNGTGWNGIGVLSYGDNTIENNATNNDAPPSATGK